MVNIKKTWNRGRYVHEETMNLKIGEINNQILNSPKWPDNPHLGVFVQPNTMKKSTANWLDIGTKLKVESQINLETFQSNAVVSIESIYEVSQSGNELKLTETRSSRSKPIEYVFTKI